MRRFQHGIALFLLSVAPGLSPALAQQSFSDAVLTGKTRLACEALLCLSSGTQPSECAPALAHYFGINMKKLSDTLDARLAFLQLCPASNHSTAMSDLARAISRGAGRCDAVSLNRTLGDKLPSYCNVYSAHEFTDFDGTLPRYIGTPKEGGYWVESKDYEQELIKYEKALAERKEREERERNGYGYGSGGN